VFLDLHIPRKDGFEVLAWKETQPGLKEVVFIAVSGTVSLGEVTKAYRHGARTFLAKPFRDVEVRNIVEAFPGAFPKAEEGDGS
jgi:CheY-like chemotaxis protein